MKKLVLCLALFGCGEEEKKPQETPRQPTSNPQEIKVEADITMRSESENCGQCHSYHYR